MDIEPKPQPRSIYDRNTYDVVKHLEAANELIVCKEAVERIDEETRRYGDEETASDAEYCYAELEAAQADYNGWLTTAYLVSMGDDEYREYMSDLNCPF